MRRDSEQAKIILERVGKAHSIMIAPLFWGLGHATRCIPIINLLLSAGKEISLASDGEALTFLRKEFPALKCFSLPGYNIHYKYDSMIVNMLTQSVKIFTAIKKEKETVRQLVLSNDIDLLISDNRYGVISSSCENIIISHQIQIQEQHKWAAYLASSYNKYLINKFDECWIPDHEGNKTLAGKLSNQSGLKSAYYIGPLSRFVHKQHITSRKYLVILSGPEPKRTILEEQLLELLAGKDFLMVRGKLENNKTQSDNIVDYLQSAELLQEIYKSEIVICRSGYSSIMDLVVLKKKAILIPTPGQSEQEYLSEHLKITYPQQFKVVKESLLSSFDF